MLESWLFQFFLKGNWQINTTLFSQYRKPVNQRTIFLNLTTPNFRSGKWCKGKAKISNHQIFDELFWNFFFKNLRSNSSNRCFPDCGCKDTVYFLFSKLFQYFFLSFFTQKTLYTLFSATYTQNFFNTFFPALNIYKYRYRKHSVYLNINDNLIKTTNPNLNKWRMIDNASRKIQQKTLAT